MNDPHAGHLVQMYGCDSRALVRSVGRYVADALIAGEGVVLIATGEHQALFREELRALGHDPALAEVDSRLAVLDADETLASFIIDGQPDAERFAATISPVVTRLRERCPAGVRAFGEMVGVLWQAGRFSAAIRLEELWNALLRDDDFRLYCAYPIDVCGESFTPVEVDAVMSAHTHFVTGGSGLESALDRAMEDVLGASAPSVANLMNLNARPSWAALPRAEATILWLREHLPAHTRAIVARTLEYAQRA